MNPEFASFVANSNAHRHRRDANAARALDDPTALETLFMLATDPQAEGRLQAWWALELVAEKNLAILLPRLGELVHAMEGLKIDGAIRSASRICMLYCQTCPGDLPPRMTLQLRDLCLEWLVGDHKVAARAYAARALFELSQGDPQLRGVLREILEQDYPRYSSAYKAMARDLISRIRSGKG